jgi:tRNA uridine 5-carboxymethylaminomethyl modification enzyme
LNRDGVARSAYTILSYPGVAFRDLVPIWPELDAVDARIANQVEIDAKYSVYLDRQASAASALKRDEAIALGVVDYEIIPGLSNEVRSKLLSAMPDSLGQAARIEGVTPAALALIWGWIRRQGGNELKSAGARGN